MKELRERLKEGKFVITVELEPPKGTNLDKVLGHANLLKDKIDAINITDSPMANMRISSIILAYVIKKNIGVDTIFHLTCRDRNIIGLQSELLGAAALGVQNILALTGDHPRSGDHPTAAAIFEVESTGLINIANIMNSGCDLSQNKLNEATSFFIGAAANPTAPDIEGEIEKLARKIEKGAKFIQTQPVYDIEVFQEFIEKVKPFNVPVLAGVLPLKSQKMVNYLVHNVPGINVPLWAQRAIEEGGRERGIKIAAEFLKRVRKIAQGAHVMPVGDAKIVLEIIKEEENFLECAV